MSEKYCNLAVRGGCVWARDKTDDKISTSVLYTDNVLLVVPVTVDHKLSLICMITI